MRTFFLIATLALTILLTPFGASASNGLQLAGSQEFNSQNFCRNLFWRRSEGRALFAERFYFLRVNRGTTRSVVLMLVFNTDTEKIFLSEEDAETIGTEVQANPMAFGFDVDGVYTIALPRGKSVAEVGCKYYDFRVP